MLENLLQRLFQNFFGSRKLGEYSLAALLSGNHILIEDRPGTGKTTLANELALLFQLDFKRVQGTPDLLPGDILGNMIFSQTTSQFELRKGPIFTEVLFFDELNRANPRTQSALLQAMAEKKVSIDRETLPLSTYFLVVATQNPIQYEGTFPLPESQLDRFSISLEINYPDLDKEILIIKKDLGLLPPSKGFSPFTREDLSRIRGEISRVHIDEKVLKYIARLLQASRNHTSVECGVSARGGVALGTLGRALAYVRGRDFVTPDDIQELTLPVFKHRLICQRPLEIIQEIIESTPVDF